MKQKPRNIRSNESSRTVLVFYTFTISTGKSMHVQTGLIQIMNHINQLQNKCLNIVKNVPQGILSSSSSSFFFLYINVFTHNIFKHTRSHTFILSFAYNRLSFRRAFIVAVREGWTGWTFYSRRQRNPVCVSLISSFMLVKSLKNSFLARRKENREGSFRGKRTNPCLGLFVKGFWNFSVRIFGSDLLPG